MRVWTIRTLISSVLLFSPLSYAEEDTSADTQAFGQTVSQAPGVILKVPVDAQGREDSSAAELRLATSQVTESGSIVESFAQGISTTSAAQISGQDIAKDSSTCGFFSYQYSWGWMPSYYYLTYTPVYYNAGVTYQYSYPLIYTPAPIYGYRYYYYPRIYF